MGSRKAALIAAVCLGVTGCDAPPAPAQALAYRVGAVQLEGAEAVAVSALADGSAIVLSAFSGPLDMGGQKLTSKCRLGEHPIDLALVRLDAAGVGQWSRQIPCAEPTAMTVAPDGDLLIAGIYRDVVDFGEGPVMPAPGSRCVFFLRLDAQGKNRWVRTYVSPRSQRVSDIAIDAAGDIVLTGGLMGSAQGGVPLGAHDAQPILPDKVNLMVGKLGPTGEPIFGRVFPSAIWQTPRLAVDAAGNIAVIATLRSNRTDLGAGRIGIDGGVLVGRFDRDGKTLWAKVFGNRPDAVHDVDIDEDGSLLIVGETASAIDFGGGTVGHGAGEDATDPVVVRLDAAGAHRASRALGSSTMFGTATDASGTSIVSDKAGGAWIAGPIRAGEVDLGGGSVGVGAGNFIGHLDANFQHVWSTSSIGHERFTPGAQKLARAGDGSAVLFFDVGRLLRNGSSTYGLVVARFNP